MFEIFNRENTVSELNLICQFDNQDYFEAISTGVNRYRFKQILPIIGHSYIRQDWQFHISYKISYTSITAYVWSI